MYKKTDLNNGLFLFQDLLVDAKKSQKDVKKFINDLLDKAKTL